MVTEGLLLIDKSAGMTSHDVVEAVRRKLAIRRVGHTGTLDPMACGLLILLIGRATKCQQALQAHEKIYEAQLRLGTQTDTGDAEGAVIRSAPVPVLAPEALAALFASLRGPLRQTPPAYSAVKVRGRPAYWWTRRQQPVALAARQVQLFDVSLVACREQTITFRVHCSSGTYIRTLAETVAERLGTVGHLAGLVRLRIGAWRLEDAVPLAWVQAADPEAVVRRLQPVPAALNPGAASAR